MSEGFYLTYPRAYPSLAHLRRFWEGGEFGGAGRSGSVGAHR